MPKKISYRSDLLSDLRNDIGYAAKYLSAAIADSQEAFLVALRDVAEAKKMAHVAEEANISRESLYIATVGDTVHIAVSTPTEQSEGIHAGFLPGFIAYATGAIDQNTINNAIGD